MRFFVVGGLFVAIIATSASSSSSPSKSLFGIIPSVRNRQQQHSWIGSIIPRGGSTDDASNYNDADSEQPQQPVYHPGLLDAIIPPSLGDATITASSDYRLSISSSKAKELQIQSGELVAIIGKRRRASYAKVHVLPKGAAASNDEAKVSRNLATNLRLRSMDKVKVVPLLSSSSEDNDDDEEECESKAYNMGNKPTSIASSITFHPLKDSLTSLDHKEGGGGDGLSDEEVLERFITPYLNLDDDDDTMGKSS